LQSNTIRDIGRYQLSHNFENVMTPLSMRQLEMVRALAQFRHFGRAAKMLGVSQPSLTRSLKHLEEGLQVRLFERHDGVTPTLFGCVLIERGEFVLSGLSELTREIMLLKGLEIGELTICAAPFPAEISAQKALGLLAARHPGLKLQMRAIDWMRAFDEVLHGGADLGFADISDANLHHDLETRIVRTSRLHFYCRTGHPLAGRTELGVEDLMEFPWVSPSAPARVRMALPFADKPFGVFDPVTDRFRPRIVVDTLAAAKDVVLASEGLSVTLPALIEREIENGDCVLLPADLPWLHLNYGFFWKRGRTHSPAAAAYMQIVEAIESETPA
jgi:DNA-binding transcriptional LysR family regulator